MNITKKSCLVVVAGMLAILSQVASAHGLDGHHASFMTVLQHSLIAMESEAGAISPR